MNTVTIFILVLLSFGHRPAVVIERFATLNDCESAREQLVSGGAGESKSLTRCIKATVARIGQ